MLTVPHVQDTDASGNTLAQLKKLESQIKRRTGKCIPGFIGEHCHEVFITTCSRRTVRGYPDVCEFTLKGWDNEGNFIKWVGQSDDIEVTENHPKGTLLAAERQKPLIVSV